MMLFKAWALRNGSSKLVLRLIPIRGPFFVYCEGVLSHPSNSVASKLDILFSREHRLRFVVKTGQESLSVVRWAGAGLLLKSWGLLQLLRVAGAHCGSTDGFLDWAREVRIRHGNGTFGKWSM